MREALDLGRMSARLAPALGAIGPVEGLEVSAAAVVGCSWGKRVVLMYETSGPSAPGPALIGKVYADHERGRWVHQVLEQLWSGHSPRYRCRVPRPLVFLPDLGMSVYLSASGVPLDQLTPRGRHDGVVAAGHWLAGLHAAPLHLDRAVDLDVEMDNLATWAQVVAAAQPAAAQMTSLLLDRVRALRTRLPEAAPVPLHKDFHYQHTLVDGAGLEVIDLDEMRMGDAAFDVAHFIANLGLLASRQNDATPSPPGLGSAFSQAYSRAGGPDIVPCSHDFYHGYSCLKIAKQLVTGRGPSPMPIGIQLTQQLDFMLSHGLTGLPR